MTASGGIGSADGPGRVVVQFGDEKGGFKQVSWFEGNGVTILLGQ
jgi:hypothetical protein